MGTGKLQQLSDIKGRYDTVPMPSAENLNVLIVSFEGVYRHGAMGNEDAHRMIGVIREGLAEYPSHGLILNLGMLQYDYGDMMDGVLESGDGAWGSRAFPTLVVTSHRNRSGLVGLVLNVMGDDLSRWLCYSIKEALAKIDKRYKRMLRKK